MTAAVEKIVGQVKQLGRDELEELLCWLADQEISEVDRWDKVLEQDSSPGGRLEAVMSRVMRDVAEGRTKPLDEVLDNF